MNSEKNAACPVCGTHGKLYSNSQRAYIMYVSSWDYEIEDGKYEGRISDGDVICGECDHTWSDSHRFCMDYNNKYRRDETCEEGGWGEEFQRMLMRPESYDEWESALEFGLGINLPGNAKAVARGRFENKTGWECKVNG